MRARSIRQRRCAGFNHISRGAHRCAGLHPCASTVRRGYPPASRSSCASASSRDMTAAYFCCMSKRLAMCGGRARSPTQSESTSGRNPADIASTTLARTQPLVVAPATNSVCTPFCVSPCASMVPKNAEGVVLRTTSSPGRGASCGTMSLARACSFRPSKPGTFIVNTFASLSSSAKTMRLWAMAHPSARAFARSRVVCSMAWAMFPPPNWSGSAKPLTKSTISRPNGGFGDKEAPKPCSSYVAKSLFMGARTLAIQHDAALDDRLSVQLHCATAHRNVDVTSGRARAARLVVGPERNEEVALERSRIHADGRFVVVVGQRRPADSRLQAPADVRQGVGLRILETGHVVREQLRMQSAFDRLRKAVADLDLDGLRDVHLHRQQDVAPVEHDASARLAFVREGQRKAAWPVVPAARLVDETVLRDRRELSQRAPQVSAGVRGDVHLARLGDALAGAQHAQAVGFGWHHAAQHLGRFDRQQDLGAGGQDVVL